MGRVGMVAVFGIAAACAVPSIDGDDLTVAPPRPREPSETRTDGTPLPAPTTKSGTTAPTTNDGAARSDAGAGAGPSDASTGAADGASTTPVLCTASDLVLCFPFENSVTDKGPNAIAPAQSTNVTFVLGKDGRAAVFDATSAVRFGGNAAFDVTNATVEAWIKRTANPGGDGVIFDADGRFSLTLEPDGDVKCKTGNADVVAGKVTADVWAHVACTFDGAKLRVYIDGSLKDTDNGSIGSSPGSGAAIGGNAPAGEPFLGAIDSLRVFKVARTAAEIAAAAGK